MKKIYFLGLLVLCMSVISCSSRTEEEIDPRLEFVGTYSLDIESEVYMSDGKKQTEYPMEAYNKTFTVSLHPTDISRVNISGYYGNYTALITKGKMQIEGKAEYSNYDDGIYVYIQQEHSIATKTDNTLEWVTIIAGTAMSLYSSQTVVIAGARHNVATKR
jgi:hypothetical protein